MERPLQPWEAEHTKRYHVFKLPLHTIPTKHTPDPVFESDSDGGTSNKVARLLAKRYWDITIAHNERQFDASQEPWRSSLPSVKLEIAYWDGGPREVSLSDYMEVGKQMFGGNPDLKVELVDVTVQMEPLAEVAEVFANQTLISDKLNRSSVVVAEYRHFKGEWLMSNMRHFKGMPDEV